MNQTPWSNTMTTQRKVYPVTGGPVPQYEYLLIEKDDLIKGIVKPALGFIATNELTLGTEVVHKQTDSNGDTTETIYIVIKTPFLTKEDLTKVEDTINSFNTLI